VTPPDGEGSGRLRALYADLDGTLLGPGGSLFTTPDGPTERGASALAALQRAGVELVLVSGRTREQMREAGRILAAAATIAELGAFITDRGADGEDTTTNFGEYRGGGTPFEAMARSGAGGFLLERCAGRLEPHTPWAFQDREATMLFRGFVDPAEATVALAEAGYDWCELLDNGIIRRRFDTLDVPEVRAYHLVPRGVNKASAVALHRDRHGFAADETAAVGDSLSDAQMAGEVGRVFIVGGGEPSLHEARPDNLTIVEEPAGEGFARAVEELLGSSSA
jgi:hydroxymethylpyrimidine pyrophosphatase-like HAD family hydrolase